MGRKRKSLRDIALDTDYVLYGSVVAWEDDLNRELTDPEVLAEAEYQLEVAPYIGYEDEELKLCMREIKKIIKIATERGIKSDKRHWKEV